MTATEWTINQLIEERAQAVREEPQPPDQWDADKRLRQEREQAMARWSWVRYHYRQAAIHHGIAQEHEAKAKRLEGNA